MFSDFSYIKPPFVLKKIDNVQGREDFLKKLTRGEVANGMMIQVNPIGFNILFF